MYAASGQVPRESCLNRWLEFNAAWLGAGSPPFPLTPMKFMAIASMFRRGRYRTYNNYAQRAVDEHRFLGFAMDDVLASCRKRREAAVERGLGPAAQAEEYCMLAVFLLGLCSRPLAEGGPVWPEAMLIVGGFWMLREIEATAINLSDVTVDSTALKITVLLSASKMDPRAKGVRRSWGCVCSRIEGPCPYHTVAKVVDWWKNIDPDRDFPLFGTAARKRPEKEAVIRTVEAVAANLGL